MPAAAGCRRHKMVTGQQIADKALEAVGTPWKHQGRLVKLGLDCIGLILWVARQLGISEYEPPPYDKWALWFEFLPFMRQNMTEVPLTDIKVGRALAFRQNKYPCHCGIITKVSPQVRFVHSAANRRVVVEEEYTEFWKKATVAVFRFPTVED